MRRGEVQFKFICQSDALSADRIGFGQVYAQLADSFDPPAPVTDSSHQFSYHRQRKSTTTHGEHWRGSVRFPKISGDRLPLVEEFIESIKGGVPYVIDASLLPGVMREFEVFTPTNLLPLNRVRSCDEYELVLTFESLGIAKPVSSAAIALVSGISSAAIVGNTGTTQRFAYYHYEGTEADRSLVCVLNGSNLTVTSNGHELITHNGASQAYIVTIPASTQTSGTNILRVESMAPETAWSVRDVSVT